MPILRSFTHAERRQIAALAAAIGALHLAGFGLLALVAGRHLTLGAGGGAFGVGLGITAYTLGLRHAFDADHIAAIDNTTRKLVADGRPPLTVGFWFALGHSTIVLALAVLLALGLRRLGADVADDDSTLQHVTGLIGPLVSGTFLLLIGLTNLASLRTMLRARRAGTSTVMPTIGGPVGRLLGGAMRAIDRPWQMYAVGLLFGLGFDTATEIALLATAGAAAAGGLPLTAILCLPILFAAGMTLLDTLDGALMRYAYGWSTTRPARTISYNMVITAFSVLVALLIGTIELLQVATDRMALHGAPFDDISALNLNLVGYAIAALLILTWIAASMFARVDRNPSSPTSPP